MMFHNKLLKMTTEHFFKIDIINLKVCISIKNTDFLVCPAWATT